MFERNDSGNRLECLFVTFCVLFTWPSLDVILADQVSMVIPILKLKRLYSTVIFQTCCWLNIQLFLGGMVDLILVNSKFTASTFAKTFKCLDAQGNRLVVLYPAVNVDQFKEPHSLK
ncbi:hypothetical protein L6164_001082 [Bauhinia variegata]|uniref:Uncharacterized protein n=1 Tax=Bauhinia variegata TaxID=167791 RepID=A0ACB9Q9U3_BAUVA|nr:hypothetical protein L6164_001082 [Bauhinia variegata]